MEEGHILLRGGQPPAVWEEGGRKDVYNVVDNGYDSVKSTVRCARNPQPAQASSVPVALLILFLFFRR
jgi:hypothetical protein